MGRKKLVVSVINDLVTDQRVHKVCMSLHKMGFEVVLIGRLLPDSMPMDKRPYKHQRMRLWFRKGPFFYAEYNIRLFLKILRTPADLLLANDLDTLAASALASRLKGIDLIYDSHELFTEVPELSKRPVTRSIWQLVEKMCMLRVKKMYTVSQSIADWYTKKYDKNVGIVRNVPVRPQPALAFTHEELEITQGQRIILLQGAGINIDRGAEELLQAMEYIEGAVLLIIGDGDVLPSLKKIATTKNLSHKVKFYPKQTYESLRKFTLAADIGCTLDKDTNINYRFSLPNKLFDYIHHQTPVISSRLPEIARIIEKYEVGDFISDHDPKNIAKTIQTALDHPKTLEKWKKNCSFAAADLTWEKEERVLEEIYGEYV